MFQPGSMNYTQGFGSSPDSVAFPHIDVRSPTSSDVNYQIGQRWVNRVAGSEYVLTSQSSTGGVLTSNWALLGTTGGTLDTLTTDDTTVVTPTAGNINVAGASPLSTTGSGSTVTVNLTGTVPVANGGTGLTSVTAHDLLVGNGTSPLTLLAPSATSGVPLISQGASANPVYGTATVPGGGTGATTFTAHGVLIGEGAGPVVATTPGTTGQVLIGSTGADPAFGALGLNSGLTAHGVLLGEGTGAIVATAVGATGTLLSGNTGADPTFTASPSVTGSVTAGTTLTATLGAITATNGNLVLGTAGNKILSTSVGTTTAAGANSFGSVALTGGTATVATTAVTANSLIFLTCQALGTVVVASGLAVTAKTAGTSFVITASQATDTSTIAWMIVN
jgi:hypothetical protein